MVLSAQWVPWWPAALIMSAVRRRIRRLSSQILIAQVAILTVTMCVGFLLLAHGERGRLDTEYENRAASIAQAVASTPTVYDCLASATPTCRSQVQALASRINQHVGTSYVVVIDLHRIRLSHPNPELIGHPVEEPIATLDGRVHLGIDDGAAGRSANGKAPVYDTHGAMVGEVSVGLQESSVSRALRSVLPSWAMWFAIALGLGTLVSFALADQLKRRTFGLELDEIARLLQEREATLHGIREAVIAFGADGRLSVVNDEAHRLLELPTNPVGARLEDAIGDETLRGRLLDSRPIEDEIVFTETLCLVVNRMPVTLAGRRHGVVVTLRDRTELIGLRSELAGERGLTESLRAQQHEFANRLQAVAGLIQLGRPEEALDFVLEIRGTAAEFDTNLRDRIAAPQLVGLLLGKAAEASEAGVELIVDDASWLSDSPPHVHRLVSIVGNLLDNAIDALVSVPAPRLLTVLIVEDGGITIQVSDNGSGIADDIREHIFAHGYSTKPGRNRGQGLAIVDRIVTRLGGTIDVDMSQGAVFTVHLPAGPAAGGSR